MLKKSIGKLFFRLSLRLLPLLVKYFQNKKVNKTTVIKKMVKRIKITKKWQKQPMD